MRTTRIRRALVALVGAGLLASPPAGATDGNLYPIAPHTWRSIWYAGIGYGVTGVWEIDLPLQVHEMGEMWSTQFRCARTGTDLAAVQFGALRTAAPSSLEVQVGAGGRVVWREPDASLPQSPADGRLYVVGLPAGKCTASVALTQMEARSQHRRRYYVDRPVAFERDLASPTVAITSLPTGWINGTVPSGRFEWSTGDNFGDDGIAAQRIKLDGHLVWSGTPGQGAHVVDVPGYNLGDGGVEVLIEADGDGTGTGSATGLILVDRLPPYVNAWATYLPEEGGGPNGVGFEWAQHDMTTGIEAVHVQVNTAADATSTGEWRSVWAEEYLPHQVSQVWRRMTASTSSLVEGLHVWRVFAVDRVGNGGVMEAHKPVVVDRTPPAVAVVPIGSAWRSKLQLGFVQRDNLDPYIGLGATEIHVNENTAGARTDGWVELSSRLEGPGTHLRTFDLIGLADGVHSVRVRTRNGAPYSNLLVGEAFGEVRVDRTGPTVSRVAFTQEGERLVASWLAEDPLSGLVGVAVQMESGDGWVTLATEAVANGAGEVSVDVALVPEGSRRFRLVLVDAAGNVSIRTTSSGVDRTPPDLYDLGVAGGPPWTVSWTQTDPVGGFGDCAVSVQVKGPATDLEWREVATGRFGDGRHSVVLPTDGIAAGAYQVRVVVCDAAGNSAVAETGGLLIPAATVTAPSGEQTVTVTPPAGAPSPTRQPAGVLAGARLSVAVPGVRRGARRALTYGQAITATGRLVDARGRGIGEVTVGAGDGSGRTIGVARTRGDGRFRLQIRPTASGALRVGVVVGHRLELAGPPLAVVRLRPRVQIVASSSRAVAFGRPVLISGLVMPGPAVFGGRRKRVVLEWRDPIRRIWRPVLNATTTVDGRFRIPWRFGVRGYTIPMRVRVPVERGWRLEPTVSRAVAIRVE